MSRETDSSSSGPKGRGGSSYPPGTEPYGSAGAAGEPAGQTGSPGPGADEKRSDERKTETTLTTRIRINIPGSRPIPPVVMRTPVGEEEHPLPASDRERDRPDGSAAPSPSPAATPPPRSPESASGAAAGAAGAGTAGPAAASSERGAKGGGFQQETSEWFAPRRGSAGPPPDTAAPADSPPGGPLSDDPFGTGTPSPGRTDTPADGFPYVPGAPAGLADFDGPAASAAGPSGPTTGPATGDMPLTDRLDDKPAGLGAGTAPFATGTGVGRGTGAGGGAEPISPGAAAGRPPGHPGPAAPSAPSDPGAPRSLGAPGVPAAPGDPGAPDGPFTAAAPSDERVAGDTLVSGIPRVSSAAGDGDTPAPAGGSAGPLSPSMSSAPEDDFDGFEDKEPPQRGRSKAALVGAAVVGLFGVVYGAGLLLDHADVPNGTTVLGIDIGGTSKHEAVQKLEAGLGDSTTQQFTVVSNGKKSELMPSVAGLTLDTEATVRSAAGRDYNPVTVIGSLFGGEREAEAAIKVDDEKMDSALSAISRKTGDGGSPKDGMVKFAGGKAVAVPGKPHKGIDPAEASEALQQAYRDRAASGRNRQVELPVSMQQPKVGQKEIARAINRFGKPAMSGLVTVKAGDASIQFSPDKSLPKFLAMKPVDGTLVDTYDLPALQQLYGTTFDGVKVARGDGSRTPVMPQDVAGALRTALKETSPAKRVGEIPVDGN